MSEDKTSISWRLKTAFICLGAVASFYFSQYFANQKDYEVVEGNYYGWSGTNCDLRAISPPVITENLEDNVNFDSGIMSISGIETVFDVGGALCALASGAGGRNAINSVGASYFLTQLPEIVNFLFGNLDSGQMLGEAVKDGLLVGGCYVLGRIFSGRGINTGSKYFSGINFKKEQRSWWNGD
jgi:hypothetical protein